MLRVTRLTDYATVVMTVLAARPDEVLSASDLAERAGLETPTVSKLLKPLAQAGLVEGFRGARGGYRLARPASATTSLIRRQLARTPHWSEMPHSPWSRLHSVIASGPSIASTISNSEMSCAGRASR